VSKLVGWMIALNGPAPGVPVDGGPYLSARMYSSTGFPPISQVEQMVPVEPLLHVRFAPNSGWIVICAGNYLWYGPNFPEDAISVIEAGKANFVLDDIFFTPNSDWLIKWKKGDGSRVYAQSNNFPNEVLDIVNGIDVNGQTAELLCLVFPPPTPLAPPSSAGLFTTIWTSCLVICDNNKWAPFGTLPPDIISKLTELANAGSVIRSVVYSSCTGWLITMADGSYVSSGFDPWLREQIDQATAYLNGRFTLGDVVIEVPIRNVSFQIVSVDAMNVRSGFPSPHDTLYGEASILVDTQAPVTSFAAFGNDVKNGTLLGLNGVFSASLDQEIVTSLPAGPPPRLAFSVGPVPITSPTSSLVFAFGFVNHGSGNPSELAPTVQMVAKAAAQLVSKGISALVGFVGTPALGSITGAILDEVTNLVFSNCDGVVAIDAISMSGAALTALDCGPQITPSLGLQTQTGALLQGTTVYSNQTFPDSFTGTKSPYDAASGSFCNAPQYAISWAIVTTDTENLVGFANLATSGKTIVLPPLVSWPPGQRINATDNANAALSACEFLDQLYLFWEFNNTIFFSKSQYGQRFPAGAPVGWGPNIPPASTAQPPATCVFQNQNGQTQMYSFWKSNDSSNRILFTFCSDGSTFYTTAAINATDSTPQAPAACVFLNQLFLFWTANDASHRIFFSSYAGATDDNGTPTGPAGTGSPWAGGTPINASDSTPSALATCIFQDQLFLFWKSNDAFNRIYFTASSDGKTWPGGTPINGTDATPEPLAACVFQNQLYLFWKSNDSSNSIFYSASSDGKTWPIGTVLNTGDATPDGLAVCVFQNQICVFWRSNDASNAICQSFSQRPIFIVNTI